MLLSGIGPNLSGLHAMFAISAGLQALTHGISNQWAYSWRTGVLMVRGV